MQRRRNDDEAAVTAWMPPDARPVREGVYERQDPAGPFSCWSGRAWNADARTPGEAARRTSPSPQQRAPWRGRVEASDAPCATCRGHGVVDRGFDEEHGVDLIDECADC
jgi:hypothetical protein